MPSKLRARLRRAVFVVHLWIGLTVGLIFSVVGVSGSAIVYRRELDGMARPQLWHLQPFAGAQSLSLDRVRERIATDHPEAGPSDAALFVFQPWDDAALTAFVGATRYAIDPYDGHTLATLTGTKTLPGWMKELHTELLAGEPGEGLNGWAAVVSSLLLLSGLWLWWPATRRQIRLRLTVKRKVSLRRTTYDLHNVMGFYSLLLLFVVTITGMCLCFNKPVNTFVMTKTGGAKRPRPPRIVPQGERLGADRLMRAALEAVPGARFVTVTLPTKPVQPFSAMLQRQGAGFWPYVNLKLDPYTGQVIDRDDDATASLGRKIMRQVAVLHFGFWGGTATRILYVILGFVPLGLYITGIVLWLNRMLAKRRAKARRVTAPARSSGT